LTSSAIPSSRWASSLVRATTGSICCRASATASSDLTYSFHAATATPVSTTACSTLAAAMMPIKRLVVPSDESNTASPRLYQCKTSASSKAFAIAGETGCARWWHRGRGENLARVVNLHHHGSELFRNQ
jgi:hypothetical protein